MARRIDLTGQRFGRWLVLKFDSIGKDVKAYWKCRCDCGAEKVVLGKSLRNGKSKSCGCFQKERVSEVNKSKIVSEKTKRKMREMSKKIDLMGQRFGRLLVLEEAGRGCGQVLWRCQCDCGNKTIVYGASLRNGDTQSCGCLRGGRIDLIGRQFGRYMVLEYAHTKNGHAYWKCLCDCGTEKIVNSCHLRSGVIKSCGCFRDERVTEANYNPNLTDEDRQDRRIIPGYVEWRIAVYERDNYTCQCCGDSKGGNLCAHHLKSYNSNPELRTSPENGITLCKECHKKFHNQYGYGNNTIEQFERFLNTEKNLISMSHGCLNEN